MKLRITVFIWGLYILLLAACQKETSALKEQSETYTITSKYMAKNYTFHILYPLNYDVQIAYNALFLLDANDYFFEVSEHLTNDYKGQFILIGIEYNTFAERVNDFTFPADSRVAASGQAPNYIRFLHEELLPYISNDLGIKINSKTIAGHSLTGYFTSYLLFQQEQPNLFDNIISASPSLWWNNFYAYELAEQYHQLHNDLSARFFVSMGSLEGVMMNTHFNAFIKHLRSHNYPDSSWKEKIYPNISHRNSPIISIEEGLSFFY